MIRHRSGGQQELKPSMIKFNVAACIGCNTSDWIKFISWNNQSLHYSRIMCWLQPQILRHFTALRPERKIWSFSQVVWVIRNSDSTTIFLGVPKYWKPSCIVFLFGGSDILYALLCCLGNQKFRILSRVVWGIRNSECSPVLFRGSEIPNPLLCCLGDQKFWILSCVVWGIRNSESSPVLFGDQKFWILSCVVWGSEILNPLLCSWGIRNSESSPVLFGGSLGDCLKDLCDSLQTRRRFLRAV